MNDSRTIRVMLVDDQNLVRQGVRSLLELTEDLQVVAEATDGQEAIDMAPEVEPDVMLLDIRMPNKNGLDVLKELNEAGIEIPFPQRDVWMRSADGDEDPETVAG